MWCHNCCFELEENTFQDKFCDALCENSYNFYILKTGRKNIEMYPHRHVLKHFGGILSHEQYKKGDFSYEISNVPFLFTVERKDPKNEKNIPIKKINLLDFCR